ncbi:hypothetical protein SAMN05216559_2179 [Halomicrobium zhouii]|uniref:Uncharacterized protein n=1 Tax=Halomicrobium zhouii TaxID=767519 RepID=A0A1I6L777_9EURY|nr:hypothetical protein [Halomicrobium zhouii]SFR99262.1 hypothetical protein SAMN05216559_2179 [Halomicrobium zhouii]
MKRVAGRTLVFLAVVALAVAGTAMASPSPDNVCGACGDVFEDVASEQGVPVEVTHSTATVYVHENGSATWVVTNRVNESAADQLAASPAALHRVARATTTEGYGHPAGTRVPRTSVTASVDGRNVTFQFRERDASESRLGLTVAGTLHRGSVMGGWLLNADRFTVVGPPGTELVNEPNETIHADDADAPGVPDVDGRRVTWTGPETDWGQFVSENVYLVYGPPDTSEYHADGAVALATAPLWLENVKWYVLPPTAIYGALLLGAVAAVRRAESGDSDRLAPLLAGLGLVGIVAAVLAQHLHEPAWYGGLAAIYLVTGLVAWRRPDRLVSVRDALGVAVVAALGAGVVATTIEPAAWTNGSSARTVLEQTAYHLPVAVAPAFGLAVAGPRSARTARAVAYGYLGSVFTFFLAAVVRVPVATRPFGPLILMIVAGAVVSVLATVPLAVLAVRVQSGRE